VRERSAQGASERTTLNISGSGHIRENIGHVPDILITGTPGVGKTTLIREMARQLADHHPAGFYTEEIRDARGTREGFRLMTLCGRQLVLSHIHHPGPYRVSRYGVDVHGFEQLLSDLDLSHTQSRLVIIDEIGKMECFSRRFIEEVTALLNSPKMLIATIALKGEGFIRQVKDRPDCRLVTVTRENRDRLVSDLSTELENSLGGE
jgi:nucleoside-triphosphatase